MATWYVGPSGSDSNPGTQGSPFATIPHAAGVAAAGDTVMLLDGTYTVASTINTSKAGLTYKSLNKWGAKLTTTAFGVNGICWTNTGNNCVFDGIEFSAGPHRLGLWLNGPSGNEVKNCYVHSLECSAVPTGSGGAGIDFFGDNHLIHHNIVFNIVYRRQYASNVNAQFQGLYQGGANATVYNNLVGNIGGYGIQQWHGADASFIYNNTIFNCGPGAGGIVIGSGDSGALPGGTTDNKVYNNIVFNGGGVGIRELGAGGNNAFVANAVFNPSTINLAFAGSFTQSTLVASPTFVTYVGDGSGDYHLSVTSALIGKANSTYVPSNDLDGVARPQGGTYDIGAYEFTAAPPPDTTPPTLSAPVANGTGTTTANCGATTNEGNGTLYCYVTTSSTIQSAATVKANGLSQAISTTGAKTFNVTGLTQGTTYYANFMHEDAAGNQSTVLQSAAFTTSTPPPSGGEWEPPANQPVPSVTAIGTGGNHSFIGGTFKKYFKF